MIKTANQRLPIESFVLANMAEGVIAADEQGSIIFTNPAFDQMYGYMAGELNGHDVSILFPTVDTEEDGFLSQIRPELQTAGYLARRNDPCQKRWPAYLGPRPIQPVYA